MSLRPCTLLRSTVLCWLAPPCRSCRLSSLQPMCQHTDHPPRVPVPVSVLNKGQQGLHSAAGSAAPPRQGTCHTRPAAPAAPAERAPPAVAAASAAARTRAQGGAAAAAPAPLPQQATRARRVSGWARPPQPETRSNSCRQLPRLHACGRGAVLRLRRRPSSSSASSCCRTRAPCPPGCSRRSGRTARGGCGRVVSRAWCVRVCVLGRGGGRVQARHDAARGGAVRASRLGTTRGETRRRPA
jgi:hypothetical protein